MCTRVVRAQIYMTNQICQSLMGPQHLVHLVSLFLSLIFNNGYQVAYTRYDYTNAITIGTIISGVLVTVAALTIDA